MCKYIYSRITSKCLVFVCEKYKGILERRYSQNVFAFFHFISSFVKKFLETTRF